MNKLGFRCFTSPEAPVVLTLRQQVVALSDEQRQALLTGFEQRIPAAHLDHKLGLSQEVINYVYDGIDAIEEKARLYMRGEVEVSTGVFNTPPTTQASLNTTVRPDFIADFPALFITNTIQEMVKWCKYDGTGTFAFYRNNIIL